MDVYYFHNINSKRRREGNLGSVTTGLQLYQSSAGCTVIALCLCHSNSRILFCSKHCYCIQEQGEPAWEGLHWCMNLCRKTCQAVNPKLWTLVPYAYDASGNLRTATGNRAYLWIIVILKQASVRDHSQLLFKMLWYHQCIWLLY